MAKTRLSPCTLDAATGETLWSAPGMDICGDLAGRDPGTSGAEIFHVDSTNMVERRTTGNSRD